MLTGAASNIMEAAHISENLGPAYEEDNSETLQGPKTFNGLMLAGIYLKKAETAAAAGATVYTNTEEDLELSREIEIEEQEQIHADLQAATGCFDETTSPKVVTVYMLKEAAKEDREYVQLQNLLANNLPWGGGMQELQTRKETIVYSTGDHIMEKQGSDTRAPERRHTPTPPHRTPRHHIKTEKIRRLLHILLNTLRHIVDKMYF